MGILSVAAGHGGTEEEQEFSPQDIKGSYRHQEVTGGQKPGAFRAARGVQGATQN